MSFNFFPRKTLIEVLYACIVSNVQPCQTELILNCVPLQPMFVNHPKVLTFQKLSKPLGLFGLKSFHEFVILDGRIEPIACLVFYLVIKMWEKLFKKTYQRQQTAVKTFKKHETVPTHKTKEILFHRFLGEHKFSN